ncbi:hypothetical protein ACSBR1_019052 [Camellia fascicularis]
MFLIDMEMVQEFVYFCEAIYEGNPNSLLRLAYYEMMLWIRVNNEDKITELCDYIATNDDGDKPNFKGHQPKLGSAGTDIGQFNALYNACYPVLKTEWNVLKSVGDVSAKESNAGMLDGDCKGFLDQLFETNFKTNFRQLNAKILICLDESLHFQLVAEFPSLLVPLSSDNQGIIHRIEADDASEVQQEFPYELSS